MNRVRVPLGVALLLFALALVAWIQGLRTASVRQERLLPARASAGTIAPGDSVAVLAAGLRFAVVELPTPTPERLGLFQWMPSRTLVRWIESTALPAQAPYLVIPLEGLQAGDYAVCAVDRDALAGPREMDRPAEELQVIARLRVSPSGSD